MKAVILAEREAEHHTEARRAAYAGPILSRPSLKQLTFNQKVADKYNELISIEMELRNIFMTKNYNR